MKNNILIIVSAIILSASVLLTGCVRDDNYNTSPQNNNNNINPGYPYEYNEQFNSNNITTGWVFTDATDSAYASIVNGAYQYVDYSATRSNMTIVYTQANMQSNFSVQTSIESNKMMGLIFGASTTDNGYAFYIDTAGHYSLYKEGIGSVVSTVIIASTADTFAIKNNFNTLEIDQINGIWTGYINGTQVFSMASRSISGAGFGFKVLPGTIGYADYLVVKNY